MPRAVIPAGLRRRAPRGVRARSALAATLVLAAVLAVASGMLVLLLQRSLTSSLQTTATEQAGAVARQVTVQGLSATAGRPDALSDLLETVAGRTSLAQVLDASGTVVGSTAVLAGEPPLPARGAAPGTTRVTTEQVDVRGDVDEYRVVTLAGVTGGQRFTVVVGVSLEGVERAVETLLVLLGLGAPVLLVAVWVATSHYVGRSLAPVAAITGAVERIEDTDLRRRVPVPETDDEVAHLAATMNAMLSRLERARETQRRFVADASHELRSPVATLLAAAEVELRSAPGPALDGSGELAPLVRDEAGRMQRLVDGLLLLARVDAARSPDGSGTAATTRVEVDLDDLVLAERSRLRATAALDVEADIAPARVLGDAHQLAAVVRNLADNAARHAATRVVLRLAVRGASAVLEVADDGPGIPVGERERVFERFVRLDASRERADGGPGGSGLGLAIVAGIVAAHGGTVVADAATPGPGALLRVVLPLAEPEGPCPDGRGPGGEGQPAVSTPLASRA